MFIPKYTLIPNALKRKLWMADVLEYFPYLAQWLVVMLLLTIYLLIQFLLNVPECGSGYLGPGGIGDYGLFTNCTGGAHGYIDHLVFGKNHIYGGPTCRELYRTKEYDPEGLLGCLTSIVLCYIGLHAGRVITNYGKQSSQVLKRWIISGVLWSLLGGLLCLFAKNGGPIPINKNMWSPSFIFVMAGTGYLTLSLCYVLVDVLDVWNGAPFIYVGLNPILIYVGHELLGEKFPFSYTTKNNHAELLTKNLVGVTCWLLIAFRMFQNKFFVRI